MSIRSRLILLVLAVLAPTFLASILAVRFVYQQQLERIEQGMREATRALAIGVDRELARRDAIITTLASSPELRAGNLEAFYDQAREVAQDVDSAISLYDAEGNRLINTRRPFTEGGAGVSIFDASAPAETDTLLPVSNLYRSSTGHQYSFSVRRPVLVDGAIRYYISLSSYASQMVRILLDQRLPESWFGLVIDRQEQVVARNNADSRFVGQRLERSVHGEGRSPEGFRESFSMEGIPLLSFYSQAPESGWTVLIGMPQSEIRRSTLHAVVLFGTGLLLLLGVALALAFWVGRRISTPLRMLDESAQAMGRGEVVEPFSTGLTETDRTAEVLSQASRQIHESNQLLELRVSEAVAQAERSLKALQQGQKLEALGRLTGGIAHDFNNLLQTLTTGLQLAGMTATDPRAQKAIDACNRSVLRGTKLTRQLMAFGRHKAEEMTAVDLRELLLGMGELLEGALPSRIRLQLDLPDECYPVQVDPLQCELAVLNLVFNARDAMAGSGEIRISLVPSDADCTGFGTEKPSAGYMQLSVSDTGPGMAEDVQQRAFEPFFTTKPVGEGTGLGLAQVYGFAKQSGGCIHLHSRPGEGCTVVLLLPAKHVKPVALQEVEAPVSRPKHSARLLVADDDPLVREVIVPMLTELGFQLTVCSSGDEAIERYEDSLDERGRSRTFDLVFSDIVMPGRLDGIGLAAAIRRLTPEMPVLLATGFSERMPQDYGVPVLPKPYTVESLVAALEAELKRGEGTQEA
ncbi:hybrid sensor histidine kinase/response regulator [Pseudomonas sp. Marseille-QA0892]